MNPMHWTLKARTRSHRHTLSYSQDQTSLKDDSQGSYPYVDSVSFDDGGPSMVDFHLNGSLKHPKLQDYNEHCELLIPPSERHQPDDLKLEYTQFRLKCWDIKEMTDRRQSMYLAMLIGLIPFAIYGALTRFNPGSSTCHQRVFTMLWLGFETRTGLSLAAADVNDSWTRMYRHLNFFTRGLKLQIGGVIILLYTGGFGSATIGAA